MTKRKSYTPEFKAKVVLELLEGDDSLNAVASKYQISPGRLSDWRRQLADNASAAFSTESDARARRELVEEHERPAIRSQGLAPEIFDRNIEKRI